MSVALLRVLALGSGGSRSVAAPQPQHASTPRLPSLVASQPQRTSPSSLAWGSQSGNSASILA
jgi:hypothetical protein